MDWQHWTGPELHWETGAVAPGKGAGAAVAKRARKAVTKRASVDNIVQASVGFAY